MTIPAQITHDGDQYDVVGIDGQVLFDIGNNKTLTLLSTAFDIVGTVPTLGSGRTLRIYSGILSSGDIVILESAGGRVVFINSPATPPTTPSVVCALCGEDPDTCPHSHADFPPGPGGPAGPGGVPVTGQNTLVAYIAAGLSTVSLVVMLVLYRRRFVK